MCVTLSSQLEEQQDKSDHTELVEAMEQFLAESKEREQVEAALRDELKNTRQLLSAREQEQREKKAQWQAEVAGIHRGRCEAEERLKQQEQEKASTLEKLEACRRELHEVTQQCTALREVNRELQLTRERVELELRQQVS